jgi:hypothetical protein
MIKVAVWGPGSMGLIALRAVLDHPGLRLVGVVVHDEAKAGRDAGWLCGIDPVGVLASTDPAVIVHGDADVVVYAAAGNTRALDAVADMASVLRAGKDVVSCSVIPLVFPDAVDASLTEPLRTACAEGSASCFTSGIAPGYAFDVLPLTLTGLSRTIDTIRLTEMFNYGTYPDTEAVYDILGFGKPPEYAALAATPGVLSFGWGPAVHQLATALGVEVERLTEQVDRVASAHSFETPTGRIEAGTIGAMRSVLTGYVDGEPKIVIDYLTRMHDDLAPDWPQPHIRLAPRDLGTPGVTGRGCYRIEIAGSPAIRCELELAEDHDHDLGARVGGSTFLVNAIPSVRAARPGLLCAADLPPITGAGRVRPDYGPIPDSRRLGPANQRR